MKKDPQKIVRLAAVGDLLLTARQGDNNARGLECLSVELQEVFASCDIVVANLECTLPGRESVPTEPRVLSTEKQIRSLERSGINVVTFGNNHAFDCFDEGFRNTSAILDDIGIHWFGAGLNFSEAARPLIMEKNGITFAMMSVVDQSTGSQRFAEDAASGVTLLDIEQTCELIREIKGMVEHVIISPHWGMERFRIPHPEQVDHARRFIDSGASLVLGHHPHVVQGLEIYKGSPVAYSLGNFLANEVYWQNGDTLTWNRFERTGMLLIAEFAPDRVAGIQQIPVFDDGQVIVLDESGRGERYIEKANQMLRMGVTDKSLKREKFLILVAKPLLDQMKWSRLKRFRPGHFSKLAKLLLQSK